MSESYKDLASYKRSVERILEKWPPFLDRRKERLVQQVRHGVAAEKVAENILEDLFTEVLDWTISDLNNQVGYADLLLSRLGVKYLIIEVKRPGALAWNRRAVEAALNQALRYGHEQKVNCIGVSDGTMFYAADLEHGGLKDRVYASLESEEAPEQLWWLSVHGVYRSCEQACPLQQTLPEHGETPVHDGCTCSGTILHPKYKLPADCFAYVGDAGNPSSWKLPYLSASRSVDLKRLPKAIQCVITNYRGEKVSSIPEADVPDVLLRLARAAASVGKMPQQNEATAPAYRLLVEVLDQLGRLDEIVVKL